MKNLILLLVFIFKLCLLFAQPVPTGGLEIKGIYDEDLKPIKNKDSIVELRVFALLDTSMNAKVMNEIYYHQMEFGIHILGSHNGNFEEKYDNLRYLLVKEEKDTMIIDILGVLSQSDSYTIDRMDSLVFQKGYFRYFRDPNLLKSIKVDYFSRDSIFYMNEQIGITPSSIKKLYQEGRYQFFPKIDIDFLAENNLGSFFYIAKAIYWERKRQYPKALANIRHALTKKDTTKGKVLEYNHLALVFEKLNEIDSAIHYLNKRRTIENTDYDHFYEYRIKLFIKNNQLELALKDYDFLVKNSKHSFHKKIDRAYFYKNHLKDYPAAIKDFEEIEETNFNYFQEKTYPLIQIGQIYFALGWSNFYLKNFDTAFKYFLLGEMHTPAGNRNFIDYYKIKYDDFILRHPESAELYLAKAVSNYRIGQRFNKDDKEYAEGFEKALKDIIQAEKLGLDDFRINMYRAAVLYYQRNYEAALKEINIAIRKDSTISTCYDIKYNIKRFLGVQHSDISQEKAWNLAKELGKKKIGFYF